MPAPIVQQGQQQMFNGLNPTDFPQPRVDLSTFTPESFTEQYVTALNKINTDAHYDVSSLLAKITELESALFSVIDSFKAPSVNHLRKDELEDAINTALAGISTQFATGTVPGTTTLPGDFATWETATLTAIDTAITGIEAISSAGIISQWATDITTFVFPLVETAANDNIATLDAYNVDTESFQSIAPIYNAIISDVNTYISGGHTWDEIKTFNIQTNLDDELLDLETEIVKHVFDQFDNVLGGVTTNNQPMTSDEYRTLTADSHGVFTIDRNFYDTLSLVFNNFEYDDPIAEILGHKVDSIFENFDASVVKVREDDGTDNTKTVTIKIIIAPKSTSGVQLPEHSVTRTFKVDNTSKVDLALRELNALFRTVRPTYDQTVPTYVPSDTIITFADLPTLKADPRIVMPNPGIYTQIESIIAKYNRIVNFANWRAYQDTDGKWYLAADLTDIANTANPSGPATFRVELNIKTQNDAVRGVINQVKNQIVNNHVYKTEEDQPDELENRLITQSIIDQLHNAAPTYFVDAATVHNLITIKRVVVQGVDHLCVVFTMPDGTELPIPLIIDQKYDSPSQHAAPDVINAKAEVIHDPVNTDVEIEVTEGMTLTEEQLKELLPSLFGTDPSDNPVPVKFAQFNLHLEAIGNVYRNPSNNNLYINIKISDYSTSPSEAVIVPVKVVAELTDADYFNEKVDNLDTLINLLEIGMDSHPWPDDATRDAAYQKLDQIKVMFNDFKTHPERFLNKPQNVVDKAAGVIAAAIRALQNEYQIETREIPKDMTLPSKILLVTTAALSGLGGVVALGNAGMIATTNRKLKKNESTMRVKSIKTGLLSLSVAILLIGISVGTFIYFFVEQGGF